MECTGNKNLACLRAGNTSFEVWPVGLIFFIFANGGCTCFYEEKTKFIARATRANHKKAASLKIYLLFAQKHGLQLTQLIWSHFFSEIWQKCTNFILVQPQPLMSAFSSPRHFINFIIYQIIFGVDHFSRGFFVCIESKC